MASPEERARCRIVGTPIGNLLDLTPRAKQAIAEADIVFAEDTRTARSLLHHLSLSKPLLSYHKDNEKDAVKTVFKCVSEGKKTVLISEAGMPGISDPGWLLVHELMMHNLPFEVIPGVSACALAAVASGLCEDGRWLFAGFLPHKGTEETIVKLKAISFPIVFYESPHRVVKTIELLLKHFPPPVAVCRELTKLHEEVLWLHNAEDLEKLTVKGEFCLVVNNTKETASSPAEDEPRWRELAETLSAEGLSAKKIADILKIAGVKRNRAYQIAQSAER